MAGFLRNQQAVFPDPTDLTTPVITADNRKLVADALKQACDGLDGLEDGVFRDPRLCLVRSRELAAVQDRSRGRLPH